MKVKELKERSIEKFTLDLAYHRVWREKHIVLERIHGNRDELYALVPNFCAKLIMCILESVVRFEVECDQVF